MIPALHSKKQAWISRRRRLTSRVKHRRRIKAARESGTVTAATISLVSK
jgi:hypothetical protein